MKSNIDNANSFQTLKKLKIYIFLTLTIIVKKSKYIVLKIYNINFSITCFFPGNSSNSHHEITKVILYKVGHTDDFRFEFKSSSNFEDHFSIQVIETKSMNINLIWHSIA